ncbi:MAG: hypothetical protein NTW16_00945 [Bacteroidetes bacterium]|nr:hypothetical protein [Bacteroidota bacterium]
MFYDFGYIASWWSASEQESGSLFANTRFLVYNNSSIYVQLRNKIEA